MKKPLTQPGFALLYSVLVVGAMMSLVFGVINIVYKQLELSGVNKNSTAAFYTAESGLECGRYWSAYGAFNAYPDNPSATSTNSFATIECLGSTIGPSCSGTNNTSCGLVDDGYSNINTTVNGITNPAAIINTSFPFYNNYFTYSLGPAYNNITSAPTTSVNIWQTQQFNPTADPTDLTTAILATGDNGSAPNEVQRGAGETAGITQCLAPAFTYTLTGGGSYPVIPWTNNQIFSQNVASYFPGENTSGLQGVFAKTLGEGKTSAPAFPYLSWGPADNWSFNNSSNSTFSTILPSLTLSAAFLNFNSSNPSYEYKFGYYSTTNTPSNMRGIDYATSTPGVFVTLLDRSTSGTVTATANAIPATTNNIHFALEEITTSGNVYGFWSTNAADDYYNGTYYDGTDNNVGGPSGHTHVIVLSTPLPGTVGTNPNNSNTRLSGKYVFGFGGIDGNSPSSYSSVIVALQLAGCP